MPFSQNYKANHLATTSARTDATPSTSALGMQSIDTLPVAVSDAPGSIATSTSSLPESFYDPFTGVAVGILSPISSANFEKQRQQRRRPLGISDTHLFTAGRCGPSAPHPGGHRTRRLGHATLAERWRRKQRPGRRWFRGREVARARV
jgi:hypothetical protein